jgi:hypothetical protein
MLFHNFIEQTLKKITLFSYTEIGTSALGTKQMIFFLEHKKIINNLKQTVHLSIAFLFNHTGGYILGNLNKPTTKRLYCFLNFGVVLQLLFLFLHKSLQFRPVNPAQCIFTIRFICHLFNLLATLFDISLSY